MVVLTRLKPKLLWIFFAIESFALIVFLIFWLLGYRLVPINDSTIDWEAINSVTSWVLPTMVSVVAIFITLYIASRQEKLSLFPEKEKIYYQLERLSMHYVSYRTDALPFLEKKPSFVSQEDLSNEEVIFLKAESLLSDNTIRLLKSLKDISTKIGILNLEAEIYFDELAEQGKMTIYKQIQLLALRLENKEKNKSDLEHLEKLCADNEVDLKKCGGELTNYATLRKQIKDLQPQLYGLYFEFKRALDDELHL
ncbi:hypothetical protein [Intestinimonas massiliensis (ex Afouda et al. 2020)]|uniref:hypothetical protein n=1 Tax=Intestinimonas massiliensis (ex Afouda et al. 2020) TaxID=1673721 RepID=UPI0012B53B91|nr:hypothetical protein [Intestinimonas massiliensis (ex Afouda et al. 2020)]